MPGDRPPIAAPDRAALRRRRTTALITTGVFFGMIGMSFAAVPLYRIFCEVTGFGGTTQRADAAPGEILDRIVTVQFDANTASNLGWTFAPAQRSIDVRLGEAVQINYVVVNTTDQPVTGTASFNVTPEVVGGYFDKIDCFCFTEQTLQPGERAELPVVFFVDPKLADSTGLDYVDTITLSYTFYRSAGPAAAAPAPANDGRG